MNSNDQKMSFHQKVSISAAFAGLIASTASMMGQVPANWPASYPEWWYDADPAESMIDVSSLDDPGNQSPILQGQLLHMADIGIQELDEQLGPVGGAGFTINDFKDPSRDPSYYSPAAIGQLKYVVSKFYNRFADVGYQPGVSGWNPSIVLDEGEGDNSLLYPWKDDQTPENLSVALIGQAKFLFSWDLASFSFSTEDLDGDGIYDLWEETFSELGDLDPASDSDGDGYTALVEFNMQTNPNQFDFTQPGGAVVQLWEGLSGYQLTDLTSDSSYPDSATNEYLIEDLDVPPYRPSSNGGYGNTGIRVRGYLKPTVTAEYSFGISSSRFGEFRLNPNGVDPNGAQLIASATLSTYSDWTVGNTTVILEAGSLYYFEVTQTGFAFRPPKSPSGYLIIQNHVAIAWAPVGDQLSVITGEFLETFSAKDTDYDQLPDSFEQIIVDYDANDAIETIWDVLPEDDFEPDGFTNREEYENGTDPTVLDSVVAGFSIILASELTYGNTVTLDASNSFGTDLKYTWNFGDGSSEISGTGPGYQSVSYDYVESGQYPVTLTVTDGNTTDQISQNVTLSVAAAFSIENQLPYLVGQQINFDSTTSLGTALSYNWDFGNGNSADVATPSHSFAAEGLYDVSLTVSDGTTVSELTQQIEVHLPVTASFQVVESGPYQVAQTLSFDSSASIGNGLSYTWDFGDGGASTEANPIYSYATHGTYNVSLTVTDGITSDSIDLDLEILRIPVASIWSISSPESPYEVDEEIQFNAAASTGSSLSYNWFFGDGNTSTLMNPAHVFDDAGTYTVSLSVSDGIDVSSSSAQVVIIPVLVDANIQISPAGPNIVGQVLSFDGHGSIGSALVYTWDFGDGNTANIPLAEHSYALDGTYSVSLTVTDGVTTDTETVQLPIDRIPVAAAFDLDIQSGLKAGETLSIDATASTGMDLSYSWDFGDSQSATGALVTHEYVEAGTYTISLTVDDGFEQDTETRLITVEEVISAEFSITASGQPNVGEALQFDASASTGNIGTYQWDFGDGTILLDSSPLVQHTYLDDETYNVTLTVTENVPSKPDVDSAAQSVVLTIEAFDFANEVRQWVRASKGLPTAGGAVDTWEDQSSFDIDYQQVFSGERPLFTDNLDDQMLPSSHIDFDGIDDSLISAPVLRADDDELTLMLVWQAMDLRESVLWAQGNVEIRTYTSTGNVPSYGLFVDGSLVVGQSYAALEDVISLFSFVENGDGTFEVELYHNGVLVDTESSVSIAWDAAASAYLGRRADTLDPDFYFGELRSFVVTDTSPTVADVNLVIAYYIETYRLKLDVDDDGDELPDWWERLWFEADLSRTGDGDEDGDGILNKFEYQLRTNPKVDDSMGITERDNFNYDDRGWLQSHHYTGGINTILTHDAEGNPTAQN